MKNLILLSCCSFVLLLGCSTKKDTRTVVNVQPTVDVVHTVDGENLDLQLVGQLAMQSANSAELEKKLNDPATAINNLDLDADGNVDWITVTDGPTSNPLHRVISLAVHFSADDIQEVATIEIEKTSSTGGTVHLVGSHNVYGPSAVYQSSFGFASAPLFSYMYGYSAVPYVPYYSRHYYYSPPTYYRPRTVVPVTSYRATTQTVLRSYATSTTGRSTTFSKRNNSTYKSKVESPNKGRSSAKYAATRDTKTSQKQFNAATSAQKDRLKSGKSAFSKTKKDDKATTTQRATTRNSAPRVRNQPSKPSTRPTVQKPTKPKRPAMRPSSSSKKSSTAKKKHY